MKFAEIKKHVENFLENPIGFNETEVNVIRDSFNQINEDIHKLVDGEKLEHNTDIFNKMLSSLLLIGNKTLHAPLNDLFCAMAVSYSEAMYNWNANTFKDDVIKQQCMFISRLIELRNLMVKTTDVVKYFEDRMRLLANWSPPAYEIANEYLLDLLEKNEGKE